MSDTDTTTDVDTDQADDDTTTSDQVSKAEVEKWKSLARKHEERAKANASAADELEKLKDADKTELQRLTDKVSQAEKRASDAEAKLSRLEVALDKAPEGMALPKVRKLAGRLTGDSREDLEADASELFAEFEPPDTGDTDNDADTDVRRRPTERLRSGAVPDAEPEETDPAKLAEAVPRAW